MKITLHPSGMYGVGCGECKVPYQYAVIQVQQDGQSQKFICDLCARKLYDFAGRPSGGQFAVEVKPRSSAIQSGASK